MALYVVGGILAAVGIILFLVGQRKAKLLAKMIAIDTSDIGSLVGDQHVEIKGTASSAEPLQVPVVGIECVYYR